MIIAVVLILVCTLYSTSPSLFQYFASVNTGIRTVDPGCLCHWSPCWCWDTTFSVCMVAQFIHKACRWHKIDQYNRKNGSMRLKLINVFLTNEVISILAPLQQINLYFPRNQDCGILPNRNLERNAALRLMITVWRLFVYQKNKTKQ